MQGTINYVNVERGFGFLRSQGASEDTFFHISGLCRELEFDESLLERRVLFDTLDTAKGPCAIDIRPAP